MTTSLAARLLTESQLVVEHCEGCWYWHLHHHGKEVALDAKADWPTESEARADGERHADEWAQREAEEIQDWRERQAYLDGRVCVGAL